jgi:hypothetical protein
MTEETLSLYCLKAFSDKDLEKKRRKIVVKRGTRFSGECQDNSIYSDS